MAKPPTYPAANRPIAMGVNGMVSSAHPLASMAGVRALIDGGNAFDAAVSVASTLNVVEPYMSGVGGLGVALVYVASENRVHALDFSGRAPAAAEPSRFSAETAQTGMLAPLVPGNVAGWLTLHETYGTLERERLFQTAIEYADKGFPVSHLNHRTMSRSASRLSAFPSAGILLDADGQAPRPGSRLEMPQLADSLREIARGGMETFYRGDLADRIVKGNRELGGLFVADDLSDYEARWGEPISIEYRGYRVHTTPPNSSGFQILQTLKLMERLEDGEMLFQHPATLHHFMESVKLSVTDRIKYSGDPDFVDVPVSSLLSDPYIAEQTKRIGPDRAAVVSGERYELEVDMDSMAPGSLEGFDGGMTTHFSVADRDGNVVSITQTLGGGFGCAAAVGDTGIFLNNMANWFDLEEGGANLIGPRKRVDFVVAPTQTFRDGRFVLSMGTPGSYGILQTTPQALTNVLDFGMNVQAAIEAPRFRYFEGLRVTMEERFPPHVRRALEDLGHHVEVVEPWSMSVGGAQGIHVDGDSGVFQGGADPRRDGAALGW